MATELTNFGLLCELHEICNFQTREGKKVGLASKSELRRWFGNKAVEINGKRVEANAKVEYPISEMILFPKSGRVTLWKEKENDNFESCE